MPTISRRCYQCGDTDDHPKLVELQPGGEEQAYHFDCVPAARREIYEADNPQFKLRDSGKRGDDLRKAAEPLIRKITEAPADQEVKG